MRVGSGRTARAGPRAPGWLHGSHQDVRPRRRRRAGHHRVRHPAWSRSIRGLAISARSAAPAAGHSRRRAEDSRVPLSDLGFAGTHGRSLVDLATALASADPANETAPWSLHQLRHITHSLETGAVVGEVAREVGWSSRTLERQCTAVFGYGPATLRRILRFRRAVRLWDDGAPSASVAAAAGYADQPHLHREVRDLAGTTLATLRQDNGQKRSTDVPSGSVTVA